MPIVVSLSRFALEASSLAVRCVVRISCEFNLLLLSLVDIPTLRTVSSLIIRYFYYVAVRLYFLYDISGTLLLLKALVMAHKSQ